VPREGSGETRPRTDRVASDRRPRAHLNDHAGGGLPAAGSAGWSPGRRRAPLPTRVDGLPQLPPSFDHALADGLAELRASGAAVNLSVVAREAISLQVRLLIAWNDAINLTSIADPDRIATLHVIDSLTGLPLLAAQAARQGGPLRILDIGSGAGYPGLVLAAAVSEAQVTLVESVAKKARFLEAAAAATGLADRVTVVADRIEALAPRVRSGATPPFDVVTARAVGSLANLVELAFPVLRVGGELIAWKRGDVAAEVAAAELAVTSLGGGTIDVYEPRVPALPGHVLVVCRKAGATSAAYPRDPARRRSHPWGATKG